MEKTTIVVTPRDRFSTADDCLRNVLKFTPGPFDLVAVLGGAPPAVERRLRERFGGKVRFEFRPEFLNTAQARNLALRDTETRLTIFLDTDVFVRQGWYEPLVRCQLETGADLVGPLVLDRRNQIHTAGNWLFVTEDGRKRYATMEIRYQNQFYRPRNNIVRAASDFIEVHCQLAVTQTAKGLGLFDENLREFHEMDSALTLTRAGRAMVFEPKSVVYLYYPERLTDAEDIEVFRWKWDMDAIRAGYRYFEKKWGYDLNEGRRSESYFRLVNRRLNFFARRWPSRWALGLDRWKYRLRQRLIPS